MDIFIFETNSILFESDFIYLRAISFNNKGKSKFIKIR